MVYLLYYIIKLRFLPPVASLLFHTYKFGGLGGGSGVES